MRDLCPAVGPFDGDRIAVGGDHGVLVEVVEDERPIRGPEKSTEAKSPVSKTPAANAGQTHRIRRPGAEATTGFGFTGAVDRLGLLELDQALPLRLVAGPLYRFRWGRERAVRRVVAGSVGGGLTSDQLGPRVAAARSCDGSGVGPTAPPRLEERLRAPRPPRRASGTARSGSLAIILATSAASSAGTSGRTRFSGSASREMWAW